MGEIKFFPGVVAEEALRQRDERLDGVKLVLGDLDALAEISCGLSAGNWANARAYVATEIVARLAMLRELLGVE